MNNDTFVTGNTYRTNDYDMFKRLEGNREVLSVRVNKIRESIVKNGYIFNPIVVNEKFQIIDGQGRFEALRNLQLPVDYVIAVGAGLEECIILNASGTLWKMKDYIDSYCELGNENYIRIRNMLNKFPRISLKTKLIIATGLSSFPNETIKKGKLIFTEEREKEASDDLDFAEKFTATLNMVKGVTDHYYYAIIFAKKCGADANRLLSVMQRSAVPPAPNVRMALDNISDMYNRSLKSQDKKLYLFQLYEETMSDKYGWYGAKWGGRNAR